MNLNQTQAAPAAAPAVRVMRLPRSDAPAPEAEVFSGGEALPESEGFDVGVPLSEDEKQSLRDAGYSDEDIDLVDEAGGGEAESDLPLHSGPDAMEQAMADLQRTLDEQAAEAARESAYRAEQDRFHIRLCPLPTCGAGVRVEKGSDHGDVLGIGMSMSDAAELEAMLVDHLKSHSLGEWMAALKQLGDTIEQMARESFRSPAPKAGVFMASPEGIGPPRAPIVRSPERQAAVDALDRRLGKQQQPVTPEQSQDLDAQLRARRAQRRKAGSPDPYSLTPRFTGDMLGEMGGIVTIKR